VSTFCWISSSCSSVGFLGYSTAMRPWFPSTAALVLHFASAPSTLTMAPLTMCSAVWVLVSIDMGVYMGLFLKSVLGGVYWWVLWGIFFCGKWWEGVLLCGNGWLYVCEGCC